jgi:hypothetical protein
MGGRVTEKRETYYWTISLDVDCPKCQYNFDANDTPDFCEELQDKQVCEAVKDVSVICPECNHEFRFDIGDGT